MVATNTTQLLRRQRLHKPAMKETTNLKKPLEAKRNGRKCTKLEANKRKPKLLGSLSSSPVGLVNCIYLIMLQVALQTQTSEALLASSSRSFFDGGHDIQCRRGQPIDLLSHFPSSDPKLNCIQDAKGVWFGCQCPNGVIRCTENPDCRNVALNSRLLGRLAGSSSSGSSSSSISINKRPTQDSTSKLSANRKSHSAKSKLANSNSQQQQQQQQRTATAKSASEKTQHKFGSTTYELANPQSSNGRDRAHHESVAAEVMGMDLATFQEKSRRYEKMARDREALRTTTTTTTTEPPQTTTELEWATDYSDATPENPPISNELPAASTAEVEQVASSTELLPTVNPYLLVTTPPPQSATETPTTTTDPTSDMQEVSNEAVFYVALGAEFLVISVILGLAACFRYRDLREANLDIRKPTSLV